MVESATVHAVVLYSPAARRVLQWPVSVAAGGVVLDALRASGLPGAAPELDLAGACAAIWGRRVSLQERLREGDRVEVLRALRVDPKVARRERFRAQGARGAGLFARGSRAAPPRRQPPSG